MDPLRIDGHEWRIEHAHPLMLAGLLEGYDETTERPALRLAYLGLCLRPLSGAKLPLRRSGDRDGRQPLGPDGLQRRRPERGRRGPPPATHRRGGAAHGKALDWHDLEHGLRLAERWTGDALRWLSMTPEERALLWALTEREHHRAQRARSSTP
jgi:hypothetical protein